MMSRLMRAHASSKRPARSLSPMPFNAPDTWQAARQTGGSHVAQIASYLMVLAHSTSLGGGVTLLSA
jgi:hypothetical protein